MPSVNEVDSERIRGGAEQYIENEGLDKKTETVNKILNSEEPPLYQNATMPYANIDDINHLGSAILRTIYTHLTRREEISSTEEDRNRYLDNRREYANQFLDCIRDNGTNLPVRWYRESGQTCFHFKSPEKRVKDSGFGYFFNKSHTEWKPFQGEEVRAYLTVKPELVEDLPKIFGDLASMMYESGVDFNGKASTPYSASMRTDNIVLYISPNDIGRAREVIRDCVGDRAIFEGAVLSADKDKSVSGLSWGSEPSDQESARWQRATGEDRASYSQVLALKMAPEVFKSIAKKHEQVGNLSEAEKFMTLSSEAAMAQI